MKLFTIPAVIIGLSAFYSLGCRMRGSAQPEQMELQQHASNLSVWLDGRVGTIIIPIPPDSSNVISELERKEIHEEFSGYSGITDEGNSYRVTLVSPEVVGFVIPSDVKPTDENFALHVKFWITFEGFPIDRHFRDVYSADFKNTFKKLVPLKLVPHENSGNHSK